jgi:GTP pyrophosphokinase
MIGAKINGMIVPIERVPQTGEIVEILTSSASRGPSRDWLKIVTTSEARNKIRQWFKKEQRADNIVVGRGVIEAEFKKYNRDYTEAQFEEIVGNVAQRNGFASTDDLYNTLGYGGMAITKIATKLRDEFDRVVKPETPEIPIMEVDQVKVAAPKKIKGTGGIVVDGERGCQVKFARCCNPLPGDAVIGFITKGFGISVHKQDCPNVIESAQKPENVDRFVEAHWEEGSESSFAAYEALLQIHAVSSLTLIANVTMALADMKVSILAINTQKKSDNSILMNLTISCKNIDHYHSIVARLKGLRDVIDVVRGFS